MILVGYGIAPQDKVAFSASNLLEDPLTLSSSADSPSLVPDEFTVLFLHVIEPVKLLHPHPKFMPLYAVI